jgi:hypothetical protein
MPESFTSAIALPPADQPLSEILVSSPAPWSLPVRLGFRFAFCYLLLCCLPSTGAAWLFETIPLVKNAEMPWIWLTHKVSPWVAIHVFHLQGQRVTYIPTGSGDTTLDYVQTAVFLAAALTATVVWSLLDLRRRRYDTLYAWLRIFVRLTLVATLFDYGMAKVIPTQFQPPTLMKLTETYGESSPMGILWTFMGASMPYTIFAGLAELTAGALLIFRRTATLGALVSAGVMLNIVMLNFCYDVPVKLYSITLLLMSLFLLLPDLPRLANFFLLNRATQPAASEPPHFSQRWMRTSAIVLAIAFFGWHAGANGWSGWQYLQQKKARAESPLYGTYEMETLAINGNAVGISHAAPQNLRWTQLVCGGSECAAREQHGLVIFRPQFNPKTKSFDLVPQTGDMHGVLVPTWPDARHLVLTGTLASDQVAIHLLKESGEFQLTNRGFHWISEQPFQR